MREKASWALWLIFGLFLIVVGIEGALGKVLACIFAPAIVEVN